MRRELEAEVHGLLQQLKNADATMRLCVAFTLGFSLGRLGAIEAIPAFVTALKDDDAAVRSLAAFALGGIGPEAVMAIPALQAAVFDDNAAVQAVAEKALEKIRAR